VRWATSTPILDFLGLSVLGLRPDVRDRQTDVRRASSLSLNAPYPIYVITILTDTLNEYDEFKLLQYRPAADSIT